MTDKFIFFDIDLTLYSPIYNKPIEPAITLVQCLMQSHNVMFLTYRKEQDRAMTLDWLKENVDESIDDDQLIMRIPDTDQSTFPAAEQKLYIVLTMFGVENTLFIVDDNEDVCNAFNDAGIQVYKASETK